MFAHSFAHVLRLTLSTLYNVLSLWVSEMHLPLCFLSYLVFMVVIVLALWVRRLYFVFMETSWKYELRMIARPDGSSIFYIAKKYASLGIAASLLC
jgi:hypothetical protein